MFPSRPLAALVPLACALPALPAAAQTVTCAQEDGAGYTLVAFAELEGTNAFPRALNDAGVVAGSITPAEAGQPYQAFTWQDGTLTTHAFPGFQVTVADVNEDGVVVGSIRDLATTDWEIYLWDSATDQVTTVPGSLGLFPSGLNEDLLIAGADEDGLFGFALDPVAETLDVIAFGEVPEVGIGTPGSAAVNRAGTVIGAEVVFDELQGFSLPLPYRWGAQTGIAQLAVPLGGFGAVAVDVTKKGDAAGSLWDEFFTRSSALWTDNGTNLVDLGSPPNFFVSDALGMNIHRQVIVVAPNDLFGYTRGYLWEQGAWTDLSCFAPPGLFVTRPLAINDAGEILVQLTDAVGISIVGTVLLRPDIPFPGSAETPRNGTPPNPDVLQPGVTIGPVLGSIWDPRIDHTSFVPDATLDILAISIAPLDFSAPPYGTVLCTAPVFSAFAIPTTAFAVAIPNDPTIVGAVLCTQGASWDGTDVLLTNAIDITLGTW